MLFKVSIILREIEFLGEFSESWFAVDHKPELSCPISLLSPTPFLFYEYEVFHRDDVGG